MRHRAITRRQLVTALLTANAVATPAGGALASMPAFFAGWLDRRAGSAAARGDRGRHRRRADRPTAKAISPRPASLLAAAGGRAA